MQQPLPNVTRTAIYATVQRIDFIPSIVAIPLRFPGSDVSRWGLPGNAKILESVAVAAKVGAIKNCPLQSEYKIRCIFVGNHLSIEVLSEQEGVKEYRIVGVAQCCSN
jgi:hypothetical protein